MTFTLAPAATETLEVDGAVVSLETGRMARQADAAVVVRHERTLLLATVVAAAEARPGIDFLPLTVEYRERMAAAGRVPGSRPRREGRISDREILVSRLIDRTLRPLFPKGFHAETQVLLTVFSADPASDLESLALIGAAAAVHLADVPFDGPVAGLHVSRRAGKNELLRGPADRAAAELDFVVSASRGGIVMVEGRADVVPETVVVDALESAQAGLAVVLDGLDHLRERAGRPKRAFVPVELPAAAVESVRDLAGDALADAVAIADKQARAAAIREARELVLAWPRDAADPVDRDDLARAFDKLHQQVLREATLAGRRVGGRAHDEIRPIAIEVGVLPSNHGSALFTRGETQALVSTTLGGDRDALPIESLDANEPDERFMLHYNFPPFSVGETRPQRGPGRREIGHGNLARTSLLPVLPAGDYPYVLRVVSDILESNGSSSMASVCGGSLALMDAGVPLRAAVAGIAMGLIKEGDRVAVLSDILGDEDHLGDMDFKVAGTADGVTAVQLDNKLGALPRALLERALEQDRLGRLHILGEMATVLAKPRAEVASHAPQAVQLRINPDKIGALIGPGGKTIQGIQAATGARISVDNDGTVRILAPDRAGLRQAQKRVEELGLELRQNGLYLAEVTGVKDFGAFMRIGDHEGLVHISELAEGRVETTESVVSLGDTVLIRVLGTDDRGRLRLSRKAALDAKPTDALNY